MRESTTTAQINNNTLQNTTISVLVVDKTSGDTITSGQVEVIDVISGEVVGRATLTDDNPVNILLTIENVGLYNLSVEYKGNTNYTSSSYTLENVNITKRESQVTINISNDVYQDTTITVTVKDSVTNNTITDAPITVTLPDGTTIETNTGNNGTVTIPVTTPIGNSTIKVEYNGDTSYNKSEETITINTTKRQSQTIAVITNSTAGNTTLSVNITDKNTNIPVTSGNITVRDKNTNTIIGQAKLNGTNNANITTNIDTIGAYTLIVEYSGNDYYYNSNVTLSNITVSGRIASINITPTNTTNGNITVNITVHDPITNTPIPNITVTVTYPNGTTEEVITNENGTISINPELPVGKNNITVTYPGDTVYNNTTKTVTVDITPRPSTITATLNNNTLANTTITVTVNDKITQEAVTSGQVEVINTNNNAQVATGTLNGNNTITLNVNLTSTGTYNLLVKYNGNIEYYPSNTTLNDITIEKRTATVTITTVDDLINNTRINITVKDPITDTVIPNAPVIITLPNGDTINTHTGTNGTITQPITLNAGDNTITVEYSGSAEYNSTTTQYTMNIKKLASIVTVQKQTAYLGNTITLTATVTDANGNPLTGGKLVFKLNDVTLKDTNGEVIYARVNQGIASINYTIPEYYQAKTYKLSATYEGNNEYYGNRSNTPLLNIKQRQAKLTLTTSGDVQANENITFHVTITDKQDTNRVVNGYVIFKIDGLTLKDDNGDTLQVPITNNTVDYTYTIGTEYTARKHTITTVLINNTYVRSQAENNFNVTITQTNIQLNPLAMTANSNTQIIGTITTTSGEKVIGTNKVAVKIDGTTIKTSNGETQYYYINDGNINITLQDQNYTIGQHNIEVVTGERNTYTGTKNNTTLTITPNKVTKTTTNNIKTSTITNKQLVNIISDKTIAIVGETNTIGIKILDSQNQNIKKGSITFTSNGKTLSSSTITNGKALLNYKYNTPGTYNITATYNDPTNTYQTTSTQFTITIKEQPSTKTIITANNTSTTVGETLTYTSLFTDNYNNKLTTGTAKITIQNNTITSKITNGISITPITINKAGKYNITITTNDAKITRQVTVNKQTPLITIQKTSVQAGKKNTFTATITTNNKVPLNEGKIQWKINGVTLKDTKGQPLQTQIKDGTSTLNYEIPTTWAGKQINITATYTGSTNYNTKATTRNISIPQLTATATITITPTTPKTKDNITIKVTINDKNTSKKITTNDKIAIKLNQKTITTTRIKNGSITLKYKLPLLKTNNTQKITIVFGNKNYKRLDANKSFNINRINNTLTLKDTTIKKGQTLHIKAYVKDAHGEVMKRNDTYCIKLNGKTILTKRLNNGLMDFKLPINYKKKTYNMTIKIGNNYYYNGQTKNLKLTIT